MSYNTSVPSLAHLIAEWIKGDPLLKEHFGVLETVPGSGHVYFDCNWRRPSVVNASMTGTERCAARVADSKVTVVFHQHEFYKFQAAHPMFFQKLRGHIFEMHNRNQFACSEYLR